MQADINRGGALNDGYDDQNYDYILHGDEVFAKRYILKHRIGKVRFSHRLFVFIFIFGFFSLSSYFIPLPFFCNGYYFHFFLNLSSIV